MVDLNNMDELIPRINELAHKNKTTGLTDEEKAEREVLRKAYLKLFRRGMKQNIMDNLYVMDENGNKIKVEKKKK